MSAKPWWVVFNPYSPTAPTVRHDTLESAQSEAMRLCKMQGVKVHVLALEGTAYPPVEPAAKWVDRRAT